MKAWIGACLSCVAIACGGTFTDQSAQRDSSDAGGATGGASAGGAANTGGGVQHAGGQSAGGVSGSGGAVAAGGIVGAGGGGFSTGGSINPGGMPGAGGMDCSNVGCGAPPVCGQACDAPCGCCPCALGQHQMMGSVDYVCTGICWAPATGADGGSGMCTHNGGVYKEGETFRAGDGCNTCTCTAGIVGCTKQACVCDPASETRQREYIGTSPSECAVIDFACASNTTRFENSCGCGCEQGPSCPDWFDCMPSPGLPACDTNAIKTQCPYSGVAF